jgi:RNA polymerase sigma factor (sigma-70 family)
MAIQQNSSILQYVRTIFRDGVAAELTDRELLERFARRADGETSAERAFAALVARHGPMVLRVCRAGLRDEHDAHDAFQAVFLVLVHKARSLWVRDSLGPWLHDVARRVSAHARASEMQRRFHEKRYAAAISPFAGDPGTSGDDSIAAIHEELGRLPEGFRKALVLCDLEGLTHEEAAGRLGWPVGTVKSRQARGRNRLRERLVRRGLAPLSGGMSAILAAGQSRADVPESLCAATVKMAALVANGSAVAALGSAATVFLTRGALKAMFVSRVTRIAVAAGLILGAAVTTTSFAIQSGAGAQDPAAAKAHAGGDPAAKANSVRTRSLPRASDPVQSRRAEDQSTRVRELIYLFRSHRIFIRDEEWAQTIRDLTTIGKAAVPELIAELDRADRDTTIRSLVFSLRAIGDPRAVPALIKSIPKALRPPSSDCGVIITDPDLRRFMQANQNHGNRRLADPTVVCGRPVNEILSALERITNHREPPDVGGDDPLRQVFLRATPDGQATPQAKFDERQKLWQEWWSRHWQEFVTQEELRSVELPKRDDDLVEKDGAARYGVLFPTGPAVRLGPVRMLRLTESVYANGKSHLDFDTGMVFSELEGMTAAESGKVPELGLRLYSWYRKNGIDVRCQSDLESVDLRLWTVDASRWNTLETEIGQDTPLTLGQELTIPLTYLAQERGATNDDDLLTFLFTTREGGRGIVQFFPKDSNADRFRIRYRMWATAKVDPAARPSDGKVVAQQGETKGPGSSFGETATATVAQPAQGQEFLFEVNTGRRFTFVGPGVVEARILPETFNELTTREARAILERVTEVKMNVAWISVDNRLAERPDTFAFKTREGIVGLLQIEPAPDRAGSLRIRYRTERWD